MTLYANLSPEVYAAGVPTNALDDNKRNETRVNVAVYSGAK